MKHLKKVVWLLLESGFWSCNGALGFVVKDGPLCYFFCLLGFEIILCQSRACFRLELILKTSLHSSLKRFILQQTHRLQQKKAYSDTLLSIYKEPLITFFCIVCSTPLFFPASALYPQLRASHYIPWDRSPHPSPCIACNRTALFNWLADCRQDMRSMHKRLNPNGLPLLYADWCRINGRCVCLDNLAWSWALRHTWRMFCRSHSFTLTFWRRSSLVLTSYPVDCYMQGLEDISVEDWDRGWD